MNQSPHQPVLEYSKYRRLEFEEWLEATCDRLVRSGVRSQDIRIVYDYDTDPEGTVVHIKVSDRRYNSFAYL